MRMVAYPTNLLTTLNSKVVKLERFRFRTTQYGTLGSKASMTALGAWKPSGVDRRHLFQQTVFAA
jgi:hypothetical protein